MIDAMKKRAQAVRSRAALRRWEYRQRAYAKGTWFRLRRELALSRSAYLLPQTVAEALEADGAEALPVGAELAPAKSLLRVQEQQLAPFLGRITPIPVQLSDRLLQAEAVALVPFAGDDDGHPLT